MHRTAASLARHALEQLGIRYTFGIPGVHNTEIYDELGVGIDHAVLVDAREAAVRSWPTRSAALAARSARW